MDQKLTSHVRAHRRRRGFSQQELAVIIGFKSRSVVSKLERSTKTPTLNVAFALCVAFGTEAAEIFPSLFQEIETAVLGRAFELYERIQGSTAPMTKVNLDFLEELFRRVEKRRSIDTEV